ncbi:hypothetical protein GIB67_040190 [Kingdonia uniflora]|uniref:Transposase MuDR plant domain-containing protein n=1 Tax=Kingdonia uniflora TaxID=39325 RepID=A0A7J7MUX6_9MAGN|nr:hypothetical protein GIB67_040190 [Kingdonia uniflora]
MKKKRLRPSELPKEELDHLPVFYVSDDDDNMAGDNVEVVGEIPIWEEGLVENEWYDNTCIENEWHDNDMDKDNVDEGGNDDDMGGDDANVGGDNDDEGGHDVDMGWDSEDIETQVNEWIHFFQLNIDNLDAEEGYYITHSSQDGDGIPNEEDLRRCEVFGDFLNGTNNIFEEEEDVFKPQPQTDYESLHVGMEWPTISEAREYLRKFAILNKFETIQVKNESYRLRRSYDGHSMVLKGCHFEHTCTGKVGSENKLVNALWIANEIEELVRDVKTLTPKDVQTTIRRKYGVNVSYYTSWNAKAICIERITGSFDDGYNRLPELTRQLTYDRRVKVQGWDQNFVVPRAKIHIDRIKRLYNEYEPQGSDFNSWVVISKDGKKWKVNLEERTCNYNEWNCSEYHIVSSYVKTYSGSVLAISDPSLWNKTVSIKVLPPPLVRGDGRPRKVIRKGDAEGGSQQKRCHKCGHLDHNKKTCKGPPVELRPRGSQPATRVIGGGRPRGNRPKDSFGTRSGVIAELPIQPTVPTPRGRGGRGTNVRRRGNSQTRRSGSGITKAERGRTTVVRGGRGNTVVVRGGRGITEAGRGRTTVVRGGRGNTQARRGNTTVVRGGRGNTQARRGVRGTASLSQEPIIPTQGSQTSKEPPNNPYKKLFRPPREIWLI